jgi:hypothetical protein
VQGMRLTFGLLNEIRDDGWALWWSVSQMPELLNNFNLLFLLKNEVAKLYQFGSLKQGISISFSIYRASTCLTWARSSSIVLAIPQPAKSVETVSPAPFHWI